MYSYPVRHSRYWWCRCARRRASNSRNRPATSAKPGREVNAIVLTGGSAYGLDSASGVMRYLEEQGLGYDTGVARVPIVPAAAIFDLGFGSASIRPDAAAGYQACEQATSRSSHARQCRRRHRRHCRQNGRAILYDEKEG